MSKKDEAFELFGQGRTLDSPEVAALGLTKASNERYYRLWEKSQPEVAPVEEEAPKVEVEAPVTVSIRSLPSGAQFELAGRRYRKLGVQAGKAVCLRLTNLMGMGGSQKVFEASTRVMPK